MNRFAFVLLVLALCVVGFGFYSGWFALSSSGPDAESDKVEINLTVDPDKVKEDAATVKEKTAELTGQDTEEAAELATPVREEAIALDDLTKDRK